MEIAKLLSNIPTLPLTHVNINNSPCFGKRFVPIFNEMFVISNTKVNLYRNLCWSTSYLASWSAVIDRSKDSHGIEISQKQRYVYGCILLQKLMQKLATDLNAKSRRSVQQITAYELLTPERRIGPSKLPHSCSAFPGLSRSFAAPDPAPRQTWGTTRWYGS